MLNATGWLLASPVRWLSATAAVMSAVAAGGYLSVAWLVAQHWLSIGALAGGRRPRTSACATRTCG